MVYVQGAIWKKLLTDWNQYKENTVDKYRLFVSERSSKQVTDNFQHRALLLKIVETLKKSIFSFTFVNLVNKGILYFPITTGA